MSQTRKRKVIRLAATSIATALSMTLSAAGASSAATSIVTRSSSYQWPLKPFDRPHPVRASFGDPRTVFRTSRGDDPLAGSGSFRFHDGIDIDAPNGTRVYPVISGTVVPYGGSSTVDVAAPDGRSFLYIH